MVSALSSLEMTDQVFSRFIFRLSVVVPRDDGPGILALLIFVFPSPRGYSTRIR
ncbi:hypothetical protein GW17_00016820 [Ensete ventricosum]|nr:hypothetical protein GW17_00016820 [Ensete ventricosum]